MKRLPPIVVDDLELHEELLKEAIPETQLPDVMEGLSVRFDYYRSARPELSQFESSLPPLDEEIIATTLRKLYKSRSQRAVDHRQRIREIERSFCVYCGLPIAPETLDHFVPRSTLAEYSLFSLNLVPCCFPCNLKKRTSIWGPDRKRVVINPYVDAFLADECFGVEIMLTGVYPHFRLNFVHPDPSVVALCKSHAENLDLERRWQIDLGTEFRALHHTIWIQGGSDAVMEDEIYERAQISYGAHCAMHGPNYVRAVLYKAVMADHDVRRWLRENPPRSSPAVS